MPKIVINEIDQTTPGTNSESYEVVYIPGCVDITQADLIGTDGYIGLRANEPTLFKDVAAFESLCGKHGLKFATDQDYRSLNTESTQGFDAYAVPYDNIMFKAGDTDPGYILAKELLNAGMCVLYERINPDSIAEEFTTAPSDWSTKYTEYKTYTPVLDLISAPSAPHLIKEDSELVEYVVTEDTTRDPEKTYFTRSETTAEDETITVIYKEAFTKTEDVMVSTTTYYEKFVREYYALTASAYTAKDPVEKSVIYSEGYKKANNDTSTNTTLQKVELYKLTSVPADWSSNYWKDYYLINSELAQIPSGTAPQWTDGYKAYKIRNNMNISDIYAALEGVYDSSSSDSLADKGNYSIKYLTSGGYPVYEYNKGSIVEKMFTLAEKRGDCVAIIDHTDNLFRQSNVALSGSLYKTVNSDVSLQDKGDYGTMFTPWATYNRTTVDDDAKTSKNGTSFRAPASYAYLAALADSNRTNATWLAVAGATRGIVPNLAKDGMTTNIPNGAADAMQPREGIAINAITNIKPYGYTIWGNRTLKKNAVNLTATSFLNIRNLVSDVKKTVYHAARALTFEQNNEILWVNFKSKIAPTLDRMLSGYGINGYKIVRDTAHEKAQEKATICAKIILFPTYAVEDFYITIILKDDEVTVESAE